MTDKYHVLQRIFITLLLARVAAGATDSSSEPTLTEQTLQAIRDCMDRVPDPWPDEWKQEYIETIRKAIESYQDNPQYNLKLDILQRGFAPYWEGLTKTNERSLFEVNQAQIRWYTENLMSTEFPSEAEIKKLRDQYKDLWDNASDSLFRQFPFLDPNVVLKAKADDLNQCYRKIDAPLMPVYLRSMSEEQIELIKQRWNKLRYVRVDLWRKIGDSSKAPIERRDALSSNAERDYELTKKCMAQLLGQIWIVIPRCPDYYVSALKNHSRSLQDRLQSKRHAQSYHQRLEKERSRQLFQTEHIGFLLTSLLETPACFDESVKIRIREPIPLKQKDGAEKGGRAYEVDNVSQKK